MRGRLRFVSEDDLSLILLVTEKISYAESFFFVPLTKVLSVKKFQGC